MPYYIYSTDSSSVSVDYNFFLYFLFQKVSHSVSVDPEREVELEGLIVKYHNAEKLFVSGCAKYNVCCLGNQCDLPGAQNRDCVVCLFFVNDKQPYFLPLPLLWIVQIISAFS